MREIWGGRTVHLDPNLDMVFRRVWDTEEAGVSKYPSQVSY